MDVPLTTINSEIAIKICAEECGGKCCDFYLNDFHARVNLEDFKLLSNHNLDNFIVWDHGDPQLAKQPGGKCIFLNPETKLCSIYPIRPLDCRNYPYFMPEENIADHCLLYNRSSDELIVREKAKTHDIPEFNKSIEELTSIEHEYLMNLQEQPSTDLESEFSEEKILSSPTYFISILYNQEQDLHDAQKKVNSYLKDQELDYQVLSLLGLDKSLEKSYHILGISRKSSFYLIDEFEFPESVDELLEVLDFVNKEEYQNLIAGIVLPNNFHQKLAKSINHDSNTK